MIPITLLYYNHRSNVKPTHITKNTIPYFDITIVLNGTLYYVIDDKEVPVKAKSIIFFRPGEIRQRLDSNEVSDYVSFNFTGDIDTSAIPTLQTDALSDDINQLLLACDSFFFRRPDKYADKIAYVLGALLLQIQDNIRDAQINPLALLIKNDILGNYASHITLQSIAEKYHFSASYCNSVFKRETGKSIIDYLIDERMRIAGEKLIHTDQPLAQIAVGVGYDDYNYFSRLFRKHTNYTPTQYRKLYSD